MVRHADLRPSNTIANTRKLPAFQPTERAQRDRWMFSTAAV